MIQDTSLLLDFSKIMFGFCICFAIFCGIDLFNILGFRCNATNIISWTCIISSFLQSLICTFMYNGWLPATPLVVNYAIINWIFMTQSLPHLILNRYLFLRINKHPKWIYHLILFIIISPVNISGWYFWFNTYLIDYNKYVKGLEDYEYFHVFYSIIVDLCLNKMFMSKFQEIYLKQHKNISFSIKLKVLVPLILIVVSDTLLMLTTILITELFTTCLRGFTYLLKSYFEIGIVRLIVETIKAKHSISITSSSEAETPTKTNKVSKTDIKPSNIKSSIKSDPKL